MDNLSYLTIVGVVHEQTPLIVLLQIADAHGIDYDKTTINEPFFAGHCPEAPVMPGVLQIEALAQVGAILALREFEDRDGKIPFFSGIDEAKFRRPVVPGDTLTLEVTALRVGSKVQKMKGVASVDGNVTAEAIITCVIGDRK